MGGRETQGGTACRAARNCSMPYHTVSYCSMTYYNITQHMNAIAYNNILSVCLSVSLSFVDRCCLFLLCLCLCLCLLFALCPLPRPCGVAVGGFCVHEGGSCGLSWLRRALASHATTPPWFTARQNLPDTFMFDCPRPTRRLLCFRWNRGCPRPPLSPPRLLLTWTSL